MTEAQLQRAAHIAFNARLTATGAHVAVARSLDEVEQAIASRGLPMLVALRVAQ